VQRLRLSDDPSVIKTLFSTVSSDGKINVHDLSLAFTAVADKAIEPIASYDTKGSRLVCCTMAESAGGARVVRESAGGTYEVEDDEEGVDGDDDLYGDLEGEEGEQELEMDEK
jgi:protein MAK11